MRVCNEKNCTFRPHYNTEGETKALYCSAHKKDGMIDVKHPKCIHPSCKITPSYNREGENKALYCSMHKKDGMVDVKNTLCIHPNCKIIPGYNIKGNKKALYCSAHKKDDMVNVKDKICIHPKCNLRPNYNTYGETKAIFCSSHKKDGMIDVKHPVCKSDWCTTLVRQKYDGYCFFCYINLFPEKPVSHNYKTKEYAVVEYVKTKFPSHNWVADKIVNGGFSKRRPDLLLDLLYQIIIIEIDENQHIGYDCSCQNKRIMELSQDLGHRPIVFIRFNPDEYKQSEKHISSCWGQDKRGICVVKKTKKDEWRQRLIELEEHINYWINPENITNKTIETINLFYDV